MSEAVVQVEAPSQEVHDSETADSSVKRFSMLHLATANTNPEQCTACTKRRSPSQDSPRPNKIYIQSPPSIPTLTGFTKIHLPISPLRRTVSDPVNSSPEKDLNTLNSPSRPTSSLPPLPPPLRRSVSDPTSSALFKTCSPVNSDLKGEGSPNFQRLRRMKERMKEMGEWWDKVIREDDEEIEEGTCEIQHDNKSTRPRKESESETEEIVSVENVGDCLCLHFKCPCGKGYQILLSGKNCYYRLV